MCGWGSGWLKVCGCVGGDGVVEGVWVGGSGLDG